MALLKSAMRLLENIEQRKYAEALRLIEDQETGDRIAATAPDLIYKVAYCFGNQENVQLKLLLTLLLNPKLWDQICYELPVKLEKRLCERLIRIDEELPFTIQEATHVLSFFGKYKITYKFEKLVNAALNKIPPEETAAYPFLLYYAEKHPFSPRLLGDTKSVVLFPQVYELRFLQLKLAEGICDYINSAEQRCNGVFMKPLISALRFLHSLCDDCHKPSATCAEVFAEMFVLLGAVIRNESLHTDADGSTIMNMSELIMASFPVDLRILLLKRVLERTINEALICSASTSKILAWLLDIIRQNIHENVCINEMGSIFGVLERFACEDIPSSTAYYSSVLRIINAYSRDW
ncbi:hypothetical protein OESDEN_10930 [Oesophagostomum dentatum]|uniref:Uncharacterized protein n=1 Tax=Oesophagostomum dentatum TaxID=61180 RepID=A0A0B1SWB0_OESDE|nr:hypothetical protein OESDEN_10930 [Oesophagostomum dentatum]